MKEFLHVRGQSWKSTWILDPSYKTEFKDLYHSVMAIILWATEHNRNLLLTVNTVHSYKYDLRFCHATPKLYINIQNCCQLLRGIGAFRLILMQYLKASVQDGMLSRWCISAHGIMGNSQCREGETKVSIQTHFCFFQHDNKALFRLRKPCGFSTGLLHCRPVYS